MCVQSAVSSVWSADSAKGDKSGRRSHELQGNTTPVAVLCMSIQHCTSVAVGAVTRAGLLSRCWMGAAKQGFSSMFAMEPTPCVVSSSAVVLYGRHAHRAFERPVYRCAPVQGPRGLVAWQGRGGGCLYQLRESLRHSFCAAKLCDPRKHTHACMHARWRRPQGTFAPVTTGPAHLLIPAGASKKYCLASFRTHC